jgi:SAM-dependent methyltransferase
MSSATARSPEVLAGGYSKDDGTVEFYGRIQALLPAKAVVLDFGAGRGSWREDRCLYRRTLSELGGGERFVVGADVDPAIAQNTGVDCAVLVGTDGKLPFRSASIDVAVADWVLEHLEYPGAFAAEMERIVRPGGWLCARTPNRWGYVGIGSQLIPNAVHVPLLRRLQPERRKADVFPTRYRLNTMGRIVGHFQQSSWEHAVYRFNPNVDYAGKSAVMSVALAMWQRIVPSALATDLFVFLRRR